MAIALGVVFLLVLIGLLIALARRRDEPAQYPVGPPANAARGGEGDSVANAHQPPTSLLATVGAATVRSSAPLRPLIFRLPLTLINPQAVLLDGKGEKRSKEAAAARNHSPQDGDQYSIDAAGAFDPDESYDSHQYGDEDGEVQARARYSFTAEHPGELSVRSGEELTILENNDPNW